jgi:hypothetical protein
LCYCISGTQTPLRFGLLKPGVTSQPRPLLRQGTRCFGNDDNKSAAPLRIAGQYYPYTAAALDPSASTQQLLCNAFVTIFYSCADIFACHRFPRLSFLLPLPGTSPPTASQHVHRPTTVVTRQEQETLTDIDTAPIPASSRAQTLPFASGTYTRCLPPRPLPSQTRLRHARRTVQPRPRAPATARPQLIGDCMCLCYDSRCHYSL